MNQAVQNTDKEIWREEDDACAPSIFVTKEGRIGINIFGRVYVRDVRDWYQLAEEEERWLNRDAVKTGVEPPVLNEVEKYERYIQLLCMVNESGYFVSVELAEAIAKYREAAGV